MISKIKKLDGFVVREISRIHSKTLNRIMTFFSKIGSGGTVWFAFCLPLLMSRKFRVAGINIVFSLILTWVLGELILKHIVARVRPSEHIPDEEMLVKKPRFYSFPSGHSASSFSVVGTACLLCPVHVTVVLFVIALNIAFSRLYLRVHYLSDVVAGILLGFVLGLVSVPLFNIIAVSFGASL